MHTEMITGLGVFLGIVAGVFVQLLAHFIMLHFQTKNAIEILRSEVELNTSELENLRTQLRLLRGRISAGQVQDSELFISMDSFNYSAMDPLIQSGHFHKLLKSDGVRQYFGAVRFLNTENAMRLVTMLRDEHQANKSLNFLDWLDHKIDLHEEAFRKTL
ncbi:hypothetical protein [Dinoroseobacter sp. S375]|uniref:hypothetical protein n=1 Tax=Dinoroseobacter sp. S375 TaxID=3415136 RepID=UPI003C7BEDD7